MLRRKRAELQRGRIASWPCPLLRELNYCCGLEFELSEGCLLPPKIPNIRSSRPFFFSGSCAVCESVSAGFCPGFAACPVFGRGLCAELRGWPLVLTAGWTGAG